MKHKLVMALAILLLLLPQTLAPVQGATNAQIDLAIQNGLAWLATQQNAGTGRIGTSYPLADTAAAVLAFENEGHFPGGGNTYSSVVEKGLNYIFTYCYKTSISPQSYGYSGRNDNPDVNGNGLGAYFSYNSPMYETGIVMQSIVASNTPNRVVNTGNCAGMTYAQVMRDVVDWLAWGQVDAGYGRGGWNYSPTNNYGGWADNSISQWPTLGLVAAEQWGINAPQFVKNEMQYWVTYIQNTNGGSGYETPNSIVNVSKTGGLLVEFYYLGDDNSTMRAQKAINYINANWNQTLDPWDPWIGNKGHPYAMFAVFKGLELMKVVTLPNASATPDSAAGDWWGDYAHNLVTTQQAAGYWNGYQYWYQHLATSWHIVILQASVFPVSVDVIVPEAACDLTGYDVSVHYTIERFEATGTLKIYKDGVLFDTVTLTNFKGTGEWNQNIGSDDAGGNAWSAVLDVTGGGIAAHAEDADAGMIYETPHVTGIPDQITPFVPFDLDDYQTCVGDYDVEWSASGVPAGWNVTIDAEHVATVTAPVGATEPAEITFQAIFHWPGIDCNGSDTATFTLNRPPVADPGKEYPFEWYEVDEGASVLLDGTGSYDPDGDALTYAWDLDGDSVFETPGSQPTFSAAALDAPATDEVYVYLEVCDEHDACDQTLAEIEIHDLVPTAAFGWTPDPQFEDFPIQFTDQSTSAVDAIVAWEWDFGGLGSSADQNPTFTFAEPGTYSVCLTVTDDDDSTDSVCHDVTVDANPCLGVGSLTPNEIVGTDSGETLTGTSLVDHIFGLGGADTLDALEGNDCLAGGAGNDILLSAFGYDVLFGGEDDDTLDGGLNDDTLDGGPGVDTILGSGGYDTMKLRGNEGEFDTLNGGDNTDVLLNADATQPMVIAAFSASNSIEGVNGNGQPILGNASANVFDFSAVGTVSGVTYIGGEGGDDVITGTNGGDVLRGGEGADTLNGVYGSDKLYGDAGADVMDGGDGVDYLYGGAGNDLIASGGGRDHIYFDPAEDTGDSELARISDMTISDRIHLGAYGLSVTQAVSGSDLIITLPGGKTIRCLNRTSLLPAYAFVF